MNAERRRFGLDADVLIHAIEAGDGAVLAGVTARGPFAGPDLPPEIEALLTP